jgi:hypothetical protein
MGTIRFEVHKDLRCVHFKGSGEIPYEVLIEKIMEVGSHPDFDFTFNTFVDFEDAVVSARKGGLDAYEEFFKRLQESTGRRKWAIYSRIPETLQNANMAHLAVADKIAVDVFENRDEALAYLGISHMPSLEA